MTAWPCGHLRSRDTAHTALEFDYRPIAVIAATGLVNGTVICVMLCVVTRQIRQIKEDRREEDQELPDKGQSCSGQWIHEEFAEVNHKVDGSSKVRQVG